MRHVRPCLVAVLALLLVTPVAPTTRVAAADPGPKGSAVPGAGHAALTALPGLSITSTAGPLTSITISPDLNCAVNHVGDALGELHGDTACGTLLAANGVLYGPAVIPAGDSASPLTPFTPISQTKTGTASREPYDPARITTVVGLTSPTIRHATWTRAGAACSFVLS